MAGNAAPIFAKVGRMGLAKLAAGPHNSSDLTATGAVLVFTADSSNGSIINEVRVKAAPGTTTVATAFRVWVNNGSDASLAVNNSLIAEITIAAIAASTASAREGLTTKTAARFWLIIAAQSR
jgi:hypothetical protein